MWAIKCRRRLFNGSQHLYQTLLPKNQRQRAPDRQVSRQPSAIAATSEGEQFVKSGTRPSGRWRRRSFNSLHNLLPNESIVAQPWFPLRQARSVLDAPSWMPAPHRVKLIHGSHFSAIVSSATSNSRGDCQPCSRDDIDDVLAIIVHGEADCRDSCSHRPCWRRDESLTGAPVLLNQNDHALLKMLINRNHWRSASGGIAPCLLRIRES